VQIRCRLISATQTQEESRVALFGSGLGLPGFDVDACSLRSAAAAAYRAHGTMVSAVDSSPPAGTTDGSDCCSTGCCRRELLRRSLTGRARAYSVLATSAAGLLSGAPSACPAPRASAKGNGRNGAPVSSRRMREACERRQRNIHHRVDTFGLPVLEKKGGGRTCPAPVAAPQAGGVHCTPSLSRGVGGVRSVGTMRRHYPPDSASSVVGQHRCSSSVGNAALASSGVLIVTGLALVAAGLLT